MYAFFFSGWGSEFGSCDREFPTGNQFAAAVIPPHPLFRLFGECSLACYSKAYCKVILSRDSHSKGAKMVSHCLISLGDKRVVL